MKRIPLNKGFVAVVDNADLVRLTPFTWYVVTKKTGIHYAACTEHLGTREGKIICRRIYMHHLISPKVPGGHVDHRDGDGLNNQRKNLRAVSFSLNQANRKRLNRNNTSGFRGVTFNKRRNCWVGQIMVNKRGKFLGEFSTPQGAAAAYNLAAVAAFGESASLNRL